MVDNAPTSLRLAVRLLLLGALALTGCEGGTLVGRICQPGEVRACECPGEGTSRQICIEDGLRWGNCDCGASDGGCESIICPDDYYCDPTLLVCIHEPAVDAGVDGGADADGETDSGGPPCGEVAMLLTETRTVFTVPAAVSYMHVKAWGSGGNGEQGCTDDGSEPNGGPGGFSEGVFEVAPGDPLIIFVGHRAQPDVTVEQQLLFGFPAEGGGGLSGVFLGPDPVTPTDRDRALLIAGGGGSAATPGCNPGGSGNHTDAGGEETMQGSNGRDGDINGGGGGYHGGRGGLRGEPGRGGTGFASPDALDSIVLSVDPGLYAYPPRAGDAEYDGVAGRGEENGLVAIRFTCERPTL